MSDRDAALFADYIEKVRTLKVTVATLEQERDALRKDAERLRWRDVRDDLPEFRLLVLTFNREGTDGEETGWLSEEGQWMNPFSLLRVTHWLPIPPIDAAIANEVKG